MSQTEAMAEIGRVAAEIAFSVAKSYETDYGKRRAFDPAAFAAIVGFRIDEALPEALEEAGAAWKAGHSNYARHAFVMAMSLAGHTAAQDYYQLS